MTWLYTILFSGLALVSEGGINALRETPEARSPIVVEAVTDDITEKLDQTYPLNPNGRVSLSNINGSIVVEGWDRNEVRLEATKIADSAETMAMFDIKIDATPERLTVETEYKRTNYSDKKSWSRTRSEVHYKLSIPRTAVLDEIEAVNGSITISNFVNITKVSAVNGTVTAKNLRGTTDLSTVNGEVACDFERVEPGSKIALSTVNGKVNLTLPSDVSATVKADTLNGNITNDFGLPIRKGEYVGRDLYGRIGSGDVQIKLDSVNGQLNIAKKNDGRTTSPATNLLPPRSEGETNEDRSRAARIDRSIDRSVRQSHKEAAEAIKQAKIEMEKIGPELEKMRLEELKNLKLDIPNGAIAASVEAGLRAASESLAAMRDANWISGTPRIMKQSNTIAVAGASNVRVDANGCDVIVRGWDKPEVKYSFTEITRSRGDSNAKVEETSSDAEIKLSVVGADGDEARSFGSSPKSYRLEVFVPRKSSLTVVTNGEVRVGGISGSVDVKGEDNSINVLDTDGKLSIAAAGAQVRVIGFSGDIKTTTECGAVFLDGKFNSIRSNTTNSAITLTLSDSTNATIASSKVIEQENIALTPVSNGKWRLGRGDNSYQFDLEDGSLTVRNSSTIEIR